MLSDIAAFFNQIFQVWVAAPKSIRWLLIIWGFATVSIVGWIILTFKLKPLLLLWSIAPAYLKLILILWLIVTLPIGGWWLAWLGGRQRRIIRIKGQRVLDDFRHFLDQQLPQHKEDMEAITTEVSSHFPANVGPQGAEIKAQIKAACERQREILNCWQAAQRSIEDLIMGVGANRITDPLITKPLEEIGKQVEHTVKLIRETIHDRYSTVVPTETFGKA